MNIAIPSIIPQMKRPYASINDTCASGNQCEKDINLNTVLTYPKLQKKEFGINFVPPTYDYATKEVTVPNVKSVENYLNPIGMGPIDVPTEKDMEEQARLALIRIQSRPGSVQDDPTEILLGDNNMATMSFRSSNLEEAFEMPIHSSWVSSRIKRNHAIIVLLLVIGAIGGGVYYSNKK